MKKQRYVYGMQKPINVVNGEMLPVITDTRTNKIYLRLTDITKLLNELNEKIEHHDYEIECYEHRLNLYGNSIIYLQKQLNKFPPKIRELWLED